MNILFSINQKAIPLLKMCIQSILRFDKKVDFFIFHHDLTRNQQADIETTFLSCTFHFLWVDEKIIEGFPTSSRYPLEIYYRLFAPSLLPDTLDRILYLDVDIIVIQSLETLYTMDFNGNAYIACSHVNENMAHVNAKRLGLKQDVPYINTGVLLMNLKLLRKIWNKQKILDYVEENKKKLVLFDQDILTAMYGNQTKIIDYRKYNLSERMLNLYNLRNPTQKLDLDWVKENGVIIHYCGRMKPWSGKYIGCLDYFFKELKG